MYVDLVPAYYFSQRAEKAYKQKFFFQPNLLAKTKKKSLITASTKYSNNPNP